MIRRRQVLTRRTFRVRSASSLALAGAGVLAKPAVSRAADRPAIEGIQSGDVDAGSAIVWARGDRPPKVRVELANVESFRTILGVASADALPDRDFAARLRLDNLPAGQDIFYRVRLEDMS